MLVIVPVARSLPKDFPTYFENYFAATLPIPYVPATTISLAALTAAFFETYFTTAKVLEATPNV